MRVARLRRVHAKFFRTGRDSGWPQRLGDVVTGRASRKEPVGESEERVEAFAGARTAAGARTRTRGGLLLEPTKKGTVLLAVARKA